MNVIPLNVARVSNNLRSTMLLNTLRATQNSLFGVQNQLATGLRITTPSDDPLNAGYLLQLQRHLDNINTVTSNLQSANSALTDGEAAAQDAVDLVRQAQNIMLQTVGDSTTPDERTSTATVIDSLLKQLVSVANRKHLGTPLFGGRGGIDTAFLQRGDGVLYQGDNGQLSTTADTDLSQDWFTISGQEFFNAASASVTGFNDLDPAVTRDTRLSDLGGATHQGIRRGILTVSDGTETKNIDLSAADTVGNAIDLLNAGLPAALRARIDMQSIVIERRIPAGGSNITVSENGGTIAGDLGVLTTAPQNRVQGLDLDPRLTSLTNLADLNLGAGVLANGSLRITNGPNSATVSLNGAVTLQDVLNRINSANVGVRASIDPDGKRLDVKNLLSGSAMSIAEVGGGVIASALGIRSFNSGTTLASLNDGNGVTTVSGPDFRITTADGTNIDVDLDTINVAGGTVGDVLALLNSTGAGKITASLATDGNGIQITDNTSGATTLAISKLNLSPAIDGLGLNVQATGNQLVGTDVNPIKVDSAFTALIELRNALQADDSNAIEAAGKRLDRTLSHLQFEQGRLASKASALQTSAERVNLEQTATQVMTSNVRDVDISEAVVRFQQLQTALQANLQASARISELSLMNYLR